MINIDREPDMDDFTSVFDMLRGLKDGWFEDGVGCVLDPQGLDVMFEILSKMDILPFVYPKPDGGIRAEWDIMIDGKKTWDVSLDVNLLTLFGEFYAFRLSDGYMIESIICAADGSLVEAVFNANNGWKYLQEEWVKDADL
jgi:hypothetical protein